VDGARLAGHEASRVRDVGVVSDRDRTEVCVVGAGPAGLVLALMLLESGIPCVVLERLSEETFRDRRAGAA
jgi:NADPH-dependent 2,4-dienoyl-CoA reductase/sulfur reductase-like enzyme